MLAFSIKFVVCVWTIKQVCACFFKFLFGSYILTFWDILSVVYSRLRAAWPLKIGPVICPKKSVSSLPSYAA